MRKLSTVRFIGAFLLIVGLAASLAHVFNDATRVALWFCYVGPIIAGIGLLTGRASPYAVDLTRVYLDLPQVFGLVRYDPSVFATAIRLSDLAVHFVAFPLALVALLVQRPPMRKRFYPTYAILFVVIMGLSLVVGNVNCVEGGCLPFVEQSQELYVLSIIAISVVLPALVYEALRLADLAGRISLR